MVVLHGMAWCFFGGGGGNSARNGGLVCCYCPLGVEDGKKEKEKKREKI